MSKELYANAALHRFVRYKAREEILASVGDISGVEVFGTQILVAPYVNSGILMKLGDRAQANEVLSREALYELYDSGKGFITQSLATESIWQGKVCLVLKLGAGVEDCESALQIADRTGHSLAVGDWIWTLQENTRGVSICAPGATQSRVLKQLGIDYIGWPCKLLYASDVYGRLDDPNVLA